MGTDGICHAEMVVVIPSFLWLNELTHQNFESNTESVTNWEINGTRHLVTWSIDQNQEHLVMQYVIKISSYTLDLDYENSKFTSLFSLAILSNEIHWK